MTKTGGQQSLVIKDDYSTENDREATERLESFPKGTFGDPRLEVTSLETMMMSLYRNEQRAHHTDKYQTEPLRSYLSDIQGS